MEYWTYQLSKFFWFFLTIILTINADTAVQEVLLLDLTGQNAKVIITSGGRVKGIQDAWR